MAATNGPAVHNVSGRCSSDASRKRWQKHRSFEIPAAPADNPEPPSSDSAPYVNRIAGLVLIELIAQVY
jgi:hypothetical protein